MDLFWQLTRKFSSTKPFNIAVQKEGPLFLNADGSIGSGIDDGSMSIYFGAKKFRGRSKPYSYLNIEAAIKDDVSERSSTKSVYAKAWQKLMVRLVSKPANIKP